MNNIKWLKSIDNSLQGYNVFDSLKTLQYSYLKNRISFLLFKIKYLI